VREKEGDENGEREFHGEMRKEGRENLSPRKTSLEGTAEGQVLGLTHGPFSAIDVG
jgi:hypothetical protein